MVLNDIPDKWDAIAPYKYHIVFDNLLSNRTHWSEKLADSFLGFSLLLFIMDAPIFMTILIKTHSF